jgi:D-2-hydroxyacid dehydrogenase (NADP+)
LTSIKKIVFTGRLYKQLEAELTNTEDKEFLFLPEEEVTEEVLKWAEGYVAFRPTENFDFYNLKWVHSLGAGVDSFLFNREWKSDVLLTRTICSFGRKISEYCLSYMLAELQKHKAIRQQQKGSKWLYLEPEGLSGQKVIIFGTGVIGQEVAQTLSSLGVEVIGVSQSGEAKPHFSKVFRLEDINSILPEVQWVINTMPLTAKTDNMINSSIFKHLKSAGFINVGRGRSVDENSLIDALDRGNLKLAILDVFKEEPLPENSPLWQRDDIIITPHISAITSVEEAIECFMVTLEAVENNRHPICNEVTTTKGY